MIFRLLLMPLVLMAAALPAAARGKKSAPSAAKISEEWQSQLETAYNKQDAVAVSKLFDPKVSFLPASTPVSKGGVISGRAGVEKFFAGVFSQGLNHSSAKILEARPISDSAIWVTAELHLAGEREGTPIKIDARFGQVLAQANGEWLVQMMVVTPDRPWDRKL